MRRLTPLKQPTIRHAFRVILLLAILGPPILLAVFMRQNHVEIPFWDQWHLVPLLLELYQPDGFDVGEIVFSSWLQWNEHRPLFPRLIMLTMAYTSNWDISLELVVIYILACVTFATLALALRMDRRHPAYLALLAAVSMLLFSVSQSSNWLWGWQIQIFLMVLLIIWGILALAGTEFSWKSLLIALGAGVVAPYSFANALLIWPIGALLLWSKGYSNPRIKPVALLIWVLAGGGVLASYLKHYTFSDLLQKTLQTGTLFELAYFVTEFYGSTFATFSPTLAFRLGLSGVVLFLAFHILLFRERPLTSLSRTALALGWFTIGTGLMVALGRFSLGFGAANVSRYVTLSNLLWLGCLLLLWDFFKSRVQESPRVSWQAASLLVFTLLLVPNYVKGWQTGARRAYEMREAQREILAGDPGSWDPEKLKGVFPKPEMLPPWVEGLRKHQLSLFDTGRGRRR